MTPNDQITALKQAIAQQYGLLDRHRNRLERQLKSAAQSIAILKTENRRLRRNNVNLAIACVLFFCSGIAIGRLTSF